MSVRQQAKQRLLVGARVYDYEPGDGFKVNDAWMAAAIRTTRRFQRAIGIAQTGHLDAVTLFELGLGPAPNIGVAANTHVRLLTGPIERGNNLGPDVERIQRATDLNPGPWPYCAAARTYGLRLAGWSHIDEFVETSADTYCPGLVSLATDGKYGMRISAKPDLGDDVVYKWMAGGPWAHVGGVEKRRPVILPSLAVMVYALEANTGPGDGGNQSDGDGVWSRTRVMLPGRVCFIHRDERVRSKQQASKRAKLLAVG